MKPSPLHRLAPRLWPCLATIVCAFAPGLSSAQADIWATTSTDSVTTVKLDGRLVLEYRAQPNPMKVYVSQWTTPQGIQILRDSPHDHVHHHALMFALGIDNCDFWSEGPPEAVGKQVPASGVSVASASSNGRGRVTIKQTINWVNPQSTVLAVESRKITAFSGEIPAASLLTWASTLTPTESKPEVELDGRHYFGLGMRFLESMDTGVTFLMAGETEGTPVRGTEKLTRAAWCALQAKADGKPVTVAMFDAPENPRHPATWFTMQGFTYLSATLDLAKEKMTITRDKPLQVKYGVAAWDGEVGRAEIEQAYQAWLKLP